MRDTFSPGMTAGCCRSSFGVLFTRVPYSKRVNCVVLFMYVFVRFASGFCLEMVFVISFKMYAVLCVSGLARGIGGSGEEMGVCVI